MDIVVPDEFKYLYVQNEERPVVKIPAPVLRQVCREISEVSKKTEAHINAMMAAMRQANGIGLAAPQMGFEERIVIVAPSEMKPLVLINPVITEWHGEQIGQEGCLSVPGLYGDVIRAEAIAVEGFDRKGKPIGFEMSGLPARVVQHEVDHLDGILFIDKVDMATLHWSHPESESEAE